MNITQAYDITAPLTAERSPPLIRAAALLRERAETLHPKLANMLRVCAEALPQHPMPIGLCERNSDRLFFAMEDAENRKPDDPGAVDIHLAALAFDAAAQVLRGRQ